MDDLEIQRLQAEEQTYWWHISRRMILQSILNRFRSLFLCHPGPTGQRPSSDSGSPAQIPDQVRNDGEKINQNVQEKPKILDVGCGTGENFHWLSKFGEVVGTDTSELAVELANQKGTAILGRAEALPFADSSFNLLTAFDVLEHTENDSQILEEWGRVLSDQGLLFLSVPAHQWLFGPHDRALGHFRRYSMTQLTNLLSRNGFKPIFSTYIFSSTFPIFLLQRFWVRNVSIQNDPSQPPLSKGRRGGVVQNDDAIQSSSVDKSQYVNVPTWLNNFLINLGKTEAKWLKFSKLPFGSSVVVLAQKKDNNPLSSSGDRIFPSVRHAEFISASPRKILNQSYDSGRSQNDETIKTSSVQDDGGEGQDDKKITNRFKIVRQFLKFAVVGLGNTAIDIGLLNLLIYWHWPILWANTVAFIFAATNSFFLNKYWTFGDMTGKWQWQLPFYVTVAVVGLGISNAFVYIGSIIWHWDINVVKIISIGAIFLWNFLAPKFLIFKK